MRAKELINLLKTIDPDAEVLTPIDNDFGAASDFAITPVGVIYDVEGRGIDSPPHNITDIGADGASSAFLLDGVWTITYSAQERKRRGK